MFFLNSSLLLFASLTLFLYVAAASVIKKRRNAKERKKRGCEPPPTAGNAGLLGFKLLKESMKATKNGWGPQWMHQAINGVGKDVHTVRAPVLDYELIITRDIENAKALFNTQGADFDIGPHRERTFKSVFGLGVMTSRGQQWKHSRALVRPQFARDNVANLAMFEKHVQALIKRLKSVPGSWTPEVKLQPLFQNLTLDTGTEFLYGQSVFSNDPEARARLPMSSDPKAPDVANFGKHLDEVKHLLDKQGALAKYSWLVRDTAFSDHRKALHEFVDYFVQRKLAQTDEEKRIETSVDVQDKFVLLDELAKETKDPQKLRNETLNILHASRDTTAALMGWVFYFFARREDVFTKVRNEVLSTFSEKDVSKITFKDLWTLPYLPFVINETIRFVGIVPMNERAAIRDTTLPRGGGADGKSPIFVPKGRQILIPTYSMQHREDIWGADVDEYKPERWEQRKWGWDFIPFGGGARQCLGQQFARTEAMYVIVRLLQTFDKIENMEPADAPMLFHHTIENRPWSGIPVRLHIANNTFDDKMTESKER